MRICEYAMQCIPTPLAWYAHQMPPFFQQVSVAATLFLEIPVPFLVLSPFKILRKAGAYGQLLLQVREEREREGGGRERESSCENVERPAPLSSYECCVLCVCVCVCVPSLCILTHCTMLPPFPSSSLISSPLSPLLQVLICLSGNYNFFNALTMVLALALLDDGKGLA